MKTLTFYVFFLLIIFFSTAHTETPDNITLLKGFTSPPLTFTANYGQWDEQAFFRCDAGGAVIWFTHEGVYYHFNRRFLSSSDDSGQFFHNQQDLPELPATFEYMLIKTSFIDARSNATLTGQDIIGHKSNFFLGQDPSRWQINVPGFRTITYNNLYTGIDLTYYSQNGRIEYDFNVSPGADPSQIKILYEGTKDISINTAGELVIETEWGKVTEQKPLLYQVKNGERQALEGQYRLVDNTTFGFELSRDYDNSLPLIIDPILIFSTYMGGSIEDWGFDIAVDADSNVYITGMTYSTDFPTAIPLIDTITGTSDAFITKLNGTGDMLLYSTYMGGNSGDFGLALTVDQDSTCYLTGVTYSTDYPTKNPLQAGSGGNGDVFITRLSSNGDSLIYSSYLGGSGYENGEDIILDSNNNVYITGGTDSENFPTLNPLYGNRPQRDAFVTKINADGSALLFSTYMGGSKGDFSKAIGLDKDTNIFIFGSTNSDDFPTYLAFRDERAGLYDAFITRINNTGTNLIFSTYLGGSDDDWSVDMKVDTNGYAYLTGYTLSIDFPKQSPYQNAKKGLADIFVTKLDSSGTYLVFSTYLGGSENDYSQGIAVDSSGKIFITGSTLSSDFPLKRELQTYQTNGDVFVTKFNSYASQLFYSTYLGGTASDAANCIDVDQNGTVYLAGSTASTDFPTYNPLYDTLTGIKDVFITKIFDDCIDVDLDEICDNEDNCPGVYNPNQADTDSDDEGDVCDTCTDTDGDGFGNPGFTANTCSTDNCPDLYNSDQEDTDSDDIGDSCDVCINDPLNDIDNDGLCGDIDICPFNYDPLQLNGDGDNFGDSCDNCPEIVNNDQTDTDNDGIGDSCDICINDIYNDIDGDSFCGDIDNCPFFYNPDQLDADSNGIGDACEGCCTGFRGNADCSMMDEPDISDITRLIDYLYLSHVPLCCPEEADVDASGGPEPDISDITRLIDFLYISHNSLAYCP